MSEKLKLDHLIKVDKQVHKFLSQIKLDREYKSINEFLREWLL